MNWLIENSVLGLGVVLALGRKSGQKSSIRLTLVPIFKVCADFSASAATSDPVRNDGSTNVALMAVKTKEELEEQAIAIEPSAERGHHGCFDCIERVET